MSRKTEIITAIGTIGCAIGIGFVMQNGEVAEMRYGSGQINSMTVMPLVGHAPVPLRVNDFAFDKKQDVLDVQDITLTSAKITERAPLNGAGLPLLPVSFSDAVDGMSSTDEIGKAGCEISAQATPKDAAMVTLSLAAPCYAGERITIAHENMVFAQRLPEDGVLEVLMPALARDVDISVSFMSGVGISAHALVDSIPLFDRVVLQWQGETGVQIHALEFGASYGSEGHVWSGAPRDLDAVAEGQKGFITLLGDADLPNPLLAEAYTFPATFGDTPGAVALSVETEVTEANCGGEIQAKTVQYSQGKQVSAQSFSLAIPNCSAVGNFLVLNNLLQDLTVASK